MIITNNFVNLEIQKSIECSSRFLIKTNQLITKETCYCQIWHTIEWIYEAYNTTLIDLCDLYQWNTSIWYGCHLASR